MIIKNDDLGRRYLESSLLNKYSNIRHIFSTRDYGNVGLHVGDEKSKVIKNRKNLASVLGVDVEKLTSGEQVHGTNIHIVKKEDVGKGALDYDNSIKNCDGLITNITDIPLFAFYADCTPIYLYDPLNKVIGILHGGWKGTLGNIVGKSVDIMKEYFNSKEEDLIYVIGPRISIDNYEVSREIIDRLDEMNLKKYPFVIDSSIDLGKINEELLRRKGIKNIEIDNHCTCRDEMFFSHRCEEGNTGRMGGIITLVSEVSNG